MSTKTNVVNFEDAITMTGYGRFNLYLLFVAGGCLMCTIIESQGMMFIIPTAQCDLNLGVTEKGLVSSISYLGVFTSSHMWGFLADTKGRKAVILASLCMSFITSLISSLVSINWLFILMRFINGCLVGGSSAVIYAYAGEFHDAKHRAKVVSWITTFVALGTVILPGFAWLILPETWSVNFSFVVFRPWRLLIVIYSIPTLMYVLLMYILPESPKYLLAQGMNKEAVDILRTMYAFNTGKRKDEFPVDTLILNEDSNVVERSSNMLRSMWEQTIPLFKPPYVIKTAMLCLLQFGVYLSTVGVFMWYPEILNEMSYFAEENPSKDVTLCESITFYYNKSLGETKEQSGCTDEVNPSVFLSSMIISIAFTICFIFTGTMINIIGKKQLLYGFLGLGVLSGITTQLISGHMLIQVFLAAFLVSGVSVSVINAFVVELYPTQIRAMALAITLMCGRIGAVTGANITGQLMYNVCDYFLYIFGIDYFVLIVIVIFLPTSVSVWNSSKIVC